jgi:hypothetical protein
MKADTFQGDPDVLTCWKDIARYLGKGVRTVQRWEQEFGLPVRRPNGVDHKSAVIAHIRELDSWLQSEWSERNGRKKGNDPSLSQLHLLIQTSRELRDAHSTLIHETTAALANLMHSCNQLDLTRRERYATLIEAELDAPPAV